MQENGTRIYQYICIKISLSAVVVTTVLLFMQASQLEANIYSWTDRNGVKHFSNVPPPDMNAAIDVHREIAYDRDADEARWDLDKKDWDALKKELEKAEKQKIREKYSDGIKEDAGILAEYIKLEKFRLELEITRLEKMPASSFANNLDGKRTAIAFFRTRLKELEDDPQRYFMAP